MTTYLVCIAGFCETVVDEIKARSAAQFTEERGNPPIALPLRSPYIYDQNSAQRFLKELCVRLETINHSERVGIILIYATHKPEPTQRFVNMFFPFALTAPVSSFYPNVGERHSRRQRLVKHIDLLTDRAKQARSVVRLIWDQFGGNNFTPLLLPLRNFQSNVLCDYVRKLFDNLANTDNPMNLIQLAKTELLKEHPVKKIEDKRYFEDSRDLQFFSPGRDRHGFARVRSAEHQFSCFLGSRVRLGGQFDPLFHYDCRPARGELNATFPNCHGEASVPGANTHVNIAPNDYIR